MKSKKELEYESYAKKYSIEIIAVCRNCGEHWATVTEHLVIKHCDTCGKYSQLEHFMRPIDVIDAIKRIERQVK